MSIRRNEMIKIGVNKSQLKEYGIDAGNILCVTFTNRMWFILMMVMNSR